MEFNEFVKDVKKVNGPRVHKVTNSIGVGVAYDHYRKNRPKEKAFVCNESTYHKIIRSINEMIAAQVAKGYIIKTPCRTGQFYVETFKVEPKLNEEGKLVFKAPIDWDATLKLWLEDDQAKLEKILIKTEKRNITKIVYSKKNATYTNSSLVQFLPNRKLKQLVKNELQYGFITRKN